MAAASPAEHRFPLRAVFGLVSVFILKLLVVLQLKDHVLLQADAGLDTTAYLQLARRVGGDFWLGPDLYFVSPLYIYLCATVLALFDSITAIRVVQIALGTATVALTFVAARVWYGPAAAWVAAGLTTLTGLLTFYEALILQAALDPFLTAAALAGLALALTRDRTTPAVLAGVAFGLQAMNRPNVLIAAAGILVLLVLLHRRLAGYMAIGLALSLTPLLVRNGLVAGQWGTLTSHGGLNFYIGNHAAADGSYKAIEGITPNIVGQQEDARRVVSTALGRPVTDAEASSYFYDQAWAWIRDHPGAAIRLWLRKLHLIFSAEHLWLNYSYPFFAYDANTLLRFLFVGPAVLIPLGIVGLVLGIGRPRRAPYLIWLAFVPLYALSVSFFFVSERYRLPLLIPMAVGSGALIARLIEDARRRDLSRVASVAVPVLCLALVTHWPLGMDDGRAEQRLRMVESLVHRGRYDEAREWLDKALESARAPALAHFRIGRAFATAGQPSEAVRHLEEADRLDPERAEISFALGQALLDTGRAADAVPHLREAFAAGVRPDLSGYDLARALAASGQHAEAVRILEQVTPAGEADAASWHMLATLAMELNTPALAARYYKRALDASPDAVEIRKKYALLLAQQGQPSEAAREFREVLAIDALDASAHHNLAVVYVQLDRMDDARRHVTEALRLRPDYPQARALRDALSRK